MLLSPVADDAARFDIECDLADRQTGLVSELVCEAVEPLHVGLVRDQAERSTHGPGALSPAMLHELQEPWECHAGLLRCRPHVVRGQPFGGLARTRVAEAAGPQRDPLLARQLLDTAVIDQVAR